MLGRRIATLRKKNKLTQEELAKKLQISRSSLSLYELDKREPDFDTLTKIADLFNVSLDYLMGRTDQPNFCYKSLDEQPKEDLPPEAIHEIEEFKKYIRYKYKKQPDS